MYDPKFREYLPEAWKGVYDSMWKGGYSGLASAKSVEDNFRKGTADTRAILDYIKQHNAHPKPFVWHKSADVILTSVARVAVRFELTFETPH
jgi:hypothetical protein